LEQQQQERQQQQLWTPRPFQSVPPLLPSIYPPLLPHPHRFSYPLAPRESLLFSVATNKNCVWPAAGSALFLNFKRGKTKDSASSAENSASDFLVPVAPEDASPVPLVNQSLEYSHSS
jgi:hypothetical protein